MNVLVVDDDVFFQNLISHDLLSQGYVVMIAENGQRAIEMIERNKNFDVVICDVNMPILTGPSFILSLKRIFHKQLPTIIIVSASEDGEAFMKKIEIPFDYYFKKPVDMGAFNKALKVIHDKLHH